MNKCDDWQRTERGYWILLFTVTCIGIVTVFTFVASRAFTQSESVIRNSQVMHEELDRLEQLVETLPGGVAFVDVDTACVTYCNEGFRAITGRQSSDLIGRSILSIIPPSHQLEHAKRLVDNVEATWVKYGSNAFDIPHAKLPLPDGSNVICEINVRGTRVDGRREWLLFIDPRVGEVQH